jgi:putative phage-type endonuclease
MNKIDIDNVYIDFNINILRIYIEETKYMFLEDLLDITDEIVVSEDEKIYSFDEEDDNNDDNINDENLPLLFSEENECEIVESSLQLMCDYIDNDPTAICEPYFHENMIDAVLELMMTSFEPSENEHVAKMFSGSSSSMDDDFEFMKTAILDKINIACEFFYEQIIPPRSYETTFIRTQLDDNAKLRFQTHIEYLKNLPQPQQRTKEWYEFRHGLITASNAFKAFGSECLRNSLIYDKCKPLTIENEQPTKVNINTPMHWGQKYEPVSVMLYEYIYNTRVGDFGCIQHPTYPFLGASPDGIVIEPTSERFGRMLEIKNPFSREIIGVPKKDYWVQMQLQMETCDLDDCDFLETQFIEYETEIDYLDDDVSSYNTYKGIIMYFTKADGNPHYEYKPIDMSFEDFEIWSEKLVDTIGLQWVKNIYWKLETISCILVARNKKWFQDNVGVLKDLWSIVERERITGCEHRSATKRVKKEQQTVVIKQESDGCLILHNLELIPPNPPLEKVEPK